MFFTPPVIAVTFTESVQELLVARVAPDRLTELDPATAVAVPPHVLFNPLGVATTSPAGRLSVNATPVKTIALAAGFVIVKLREVVPFSGTLVAPKDLVIVGGLATVRLAEAVFPVPPLVEVTFPVVFVY